MVASVRRFRHFYGAFRSCCFRSACKKETTKMTDRKAVIKNADMSEDMQQDAVDCATQAIEKYNIEKVSFFICFDRDGLRGGGVM